MDKTIEWLLQGDASVQYLMHRDLLKSDEQTLSVLQQRAVREGYVAEFLSLQNENGHWGLYYYQPKWTSTHYTLLDLKNLGASDTLKPCIDMVTRMLDECMDEKGGMNLSRNRHPSDICVNGMILNYASYFCGSEPRLNKLTDHLLSRQKSDGGFTWDIDSEKGEPHTTICVLEGFRQYRLSGTGHRLRDIMHSEAEAAEFLLSNRLFAEDADKRFRKLSYPYYYRYDILRALEYLSENAAPANARLRPYTDWLQGKRKKDGYWYLEHQHKGNVHFLMEETGKPSRFITLKALCILSHYYSP